MALDTYANLQTAILNLLGRQTDTDLAAVIPDHIALLETDANTKLRTHYQETSPATINTVAGTASYALPANFLEPRLVKITNTDPVSVLSYMSPPEIDTIWNLPDTSQPLNYTIEGASIRFAPVPDAAYSIQVNYYQAIPALSNSNPTNWLLTNFPRTYLYGAAAETELYLGADSSDDRYTMFTQQREKSYTDISSQARKYTTGGAPLRMKLDCSTP